MCMFYMLSAEPYDLKSFKRVSDVKHKQRYVDVIPCNFILGNIQLAAPSL